MVVKKIFQIHNGNGLHARPSATFVNRANQFESKIHVEYDGCIVNGKSILGLLTLAAGPGSKVKITAEGKDADEAIKELGELISAKS